MKRSCSRRAGGFTLLEMMIVLAVLGLAAGLVLARGPNRSRSLETRAVAAEVARALRGARGQAIASNQPVEVVVDLVRHALRVGSGPPRPFPPGLALKVAARADQRLGARGAGFRFSPDGSTSGGQLELRDPGGLRLVVAVDWLTGRVSVADAPPG